MDALHVTRSHDRPASLGSDGVLVHNLVGGDPVDVRLRAVHRFRAVHGEVREPEVGGRLQLQPRALALCDIEPIDMAIGADADQPLRGVTREELHLAPKAVRMSSVVGIFSEAAISAVVGNFKA